MIKRTSVFALLIAVGILVSGCGSSATSTPPVYDAGTATVTEEVAIDTDTNATSTDVTVVAFDVTSGAKSVEITVPANTVMNDTTGAVVSEAINVTVTSNTARVVSEDIPLDDGETSTGTSVDIEAVTTDGTVVKSMSKEVPVTVSVPELAVDSTKVVKEAYLLTGEDADNTARDIILLTIINGVVHFDIIYNPNINLVIIWIFETVTPPTGGEG